jgi:hypothetical protein
MSLLLLLLVASLLLTILIAAIELTWTSKTKRLPPLHLNVIIYILILFVGDAFAGIAAWRMAHSVVQSSATSNATPKDPTSGSDAKPVDNRRASATTPDTKESGDFSSEAIVLVAAALGVFGFQGIMQKVNISIWDKGVLTLDDWISKARDNAVAAAVASHAKAEHLEFVTLATALKAMLVADLNTLVVEIVGEGKVAELDERAKKEQADPQALKAYAVVRTAPARAAAHISRKRT